MDWRRVPLTEHMVEAARVVSEAEIVIDFGPEARGWFRVTVFEDLRATAGGGERFFARAVERDDAAIQALATATSEVEAATLCLREAGVSLRRARGR